MSVYRLSRKKLIVTDIFIIILLFLIFLTFKDTGWMWLNWILIIIGVYRIGRDVLKYQHTSITLTDKSLVLKTGIPGLSAVSDNEVPYQKINSVTVTISLINQSFGCGTLIVFTGNDTSGIAFPDIERPHEIKAAIQERIS